MMDGIYLLLGTNLGDKKKNLKHAIELIKEKTGPVIAFSSIYKTAAWGIEDQPDFFNQVVTINSELDPEELLNTLHQIEKQLGRVRKEKWGARRIDIDILYYNNQVIDTKNLQVPHPGIADRRFTLEPLVELAPDFVHPALNKTNKRLLDECRDDLRVDRLEE
ncbi:MAG: 2-amino-4-hydroxy-6-hydroxymethyldihydropteridine diphosphokinase [Fulvivirga sp.]|nr:2-amino-4-hydroxy-6-hydroxymethyldihydropteridine diphosphokinase [Fulvivirga sp.]